MPPHLRAELGEQCPYCRLVLVAPSSWRAIRFHAVEFANGETMVCWCCPRCRGTWQRYMPGEPLYEAARPYIHGAVRHGWWPY